MTGHSHAVANVSVPSDAVGLHAEAYISLGRVPVRLSLSVLTGIAVREIILTPPGSPWERARQSNRLCMSTRRNIIKQERALTQLPPAHQRLQRGKHSSIHLGKIEGCQLRQKAPITAIIASQILNLPA